MKKTIISALSLALSLAAGSALAADMDAKMPPKGGEGMKHHPMFKEADTNDDGFLSKDEWKAKGDKMFSEIDTNNDGKIANPDPSAAKTAPEILESVLIYSSGPDQDPKTWSDNVCSWRSP